MVRALSESGCVSYIFPFQRSPEILDVSLIVWSDLARAVTEYLFETQFQGSMKQMLI